MADSKLYTTADQAGRCGTTACCPTPSSASTITAAAAPATAEEARALVDQVLTKADVLVGIGRDGFSRGVLVKAKGGKPVVVGIGY